MKELQGTEKQIIWATQIREEVYKQVMTAIDEIEFSEKQLKKVTVIKEAMENSNASYWIENFQLNGAKGLKKLFEYLCSREAGIAGRRIAEQINTRRT